MPGYAKEEAYYMHYSVICVQSIFQIYFAVEQEMCESFPKNVMAGCLNICTTQRYFEHWLCDVQQITCAYSSTEIFTHSRIFITYELTYQSTKVSPGTLSVCFCVFILCVPWFLLLIFSCFLVCVVCLFESPALVVFYVSMFAICVCLSVPPLLCFTPFLLLNVWPWHYIGLALLAIFYVNPEVVLVAMQWIQNFYIFSFDSTALFATPSW